MSIKGEIEITANSIFMIMCIYSTKPEFLSVFHKYVGNASKIYLDNDFMNKDMEFTYFGKGCHRILYAILKTFSEMESIKINEYYVETEESMMKDKVKDDLILELAEMTQILNKMHSILIDQKFTCKILNKDSYQIVFFS